MTQRLYIQPLTFAPSPQAFAGDAVRLAGGLAYAREFAVIVADEGQVTRREIATAGTIDCRARLAARRARRGGGAAVGELAHGACHRCSLASARSGSTCPQVMGVLNVTPDSMSDGGKFLDDPEEANAHAAEMHEAGAAIIDIGGESTRPGAAAVWEGDELKRVIPAVERSVAMGAAVSIDTRRPAVMEAALAAGAHIINDVSALRHDPRSLEFAAASGKPVILMHAPGPSGEVAGDLHAGRGLSQRRVRRVRLARRRARPGDRRGYRPRERSSSIRASASASRWPTTSRCSARCRCSTRSASRCCSGRAASARSARCRARLRRTSGSAGRWRLRKCGMDAGCQLLRVHDVFETVQARNVWRGLRDAALTDFSGLEE